MSRQANFATASICLFIGAAPVCGQDLQPDNLPDDAAPPLSANPFSRPGYTVALDSAPLPSIVARPVDLELRTTLVSDDSAMVNINGEILRIGEEYEGYRVQSISEGRVVLSYDGERLILNVYEKQLGLDEDNALGASQ